MMRWAGWAVCVAAVVGCRGPVTGPEPFDAGSLYPADGGPGDAGTVATRTPDGGAAPDGGAPPDAGDAGQALCPSLAAPSAVPGAQTSRWSAPTAVPFSCAPMPSALFFRRPRRDVAGAYARCASFADHRATALAVNADGSRVALIGVDGVARIVDVASRMVVGVLAPPRASVDLAAFSPSGDTIVTVARGERVVTLWRADSFAPLWTTALPGHTYKDEYMGAAAFSPDGTSALVSPGDVLYLLDTASGALRATGPDLGGVVLGAGYGWKGQRIAALTAPVTGMCVYSPHGGKVTTLDPGTLAPLATPITWPSQGDEGPAPGQMLVAADADVVVTSGLETDPYPTVRAFRLSDGSQLPQPAIPTLPLALSPDGTAAVTGGTGVMQLVRLADGASIASTTAAAPTAVAFSADGATIAAGSSGDNLLGIWQPAAGPIAATCTADLRASDQWYMGTSLSADGATFAVDWGPQIRILRRVDASLVSTIEHGGQTTFGLTLSPDARYVIGEFANPTGSPNFPMAIYRAADGAQVADLGYRNAYQGGEWSDFAFLPDGRRLDGSLEGSSQTGGAVMQVDLGTGAVSPAQLFSGWSSLMGMSADCPLLLASNTETLVRSCGGCQALPVATNTSFGLVSLDGSMYLSQNADGLVRGTSLWNIGSQPGALSTYPPRPEEAAWEASETPVAISAHGDRVITGGHQFASCSQAPGFTARVHDVATDTVVDDLPPGVTSTSSDLSVIAFGPVVWCAR